MRKRYSYLLAIVIGLLLGIIGTLLSIGYYNDSSVIKTVSEVSITESDTLKDSIKKIYDAVVLVETYTKEGAAIASGTGFIYKKDDNVGYIMTNHHVVEKASIIKITLTTGEIIESTFLGSDEYSDIAVLSIPKSYVIQVAKTKDSNNSDVGDTVFTVGSPLGSEYMGTVTRGILSGKDRQVTVSMTNGKYIMDVLQTDAAINSGNSGGPLVNINGEVIGITSMKLVQSGIEGMGFALPIEYAMTFATKLEKNEKIIRPLIGVSIVDAKSYYAKNYNRDSSVTGVILTNVEDNSPASISGLKKGDIITKMNNIEISDSAHFRYNLYKYDIGEIIEITYLRNSNESSLKVKLTDSLNE